MWRRLAWGTKGRELPTSKGHDSLRCRIRHGKLAGHLRRFAGGMQTTRYCGATDYASLQSTCPSTSSGESGNFISSRRLCRTRLHPTRFRFSPSPDEKFRAIVRRILGGEIENHFSSSHFQRLPSREHGRRHVGGLPQIPVSRHRIARFGVAGNHGQKVVVKVGRQTGPGPSSRIPRTVVNHRESGFR